MAYTNNRNAPLGGLSNLMAMKGRMGDTELVHMSKPEVQALGVTGRLHVNPQTGLQEAFGLQQLLPMLGTIGGTIVGGPMGGAIGNSLGSVASGKSLGDAAMSGLMTYGMSAIAGAGKEALFGATEEATKGAASSALTGGGAESIAGVPTDPLGIGEVAYSPPTDPLAIGEVAATNPPTLFSDDPMGIGEVSQFDPNATGIPANPVTPWETAPLQRPEPTGYLEKTGRGLEKDYAALQDQSSDTMYSRFKDPMTYLPSAGIAALTPDDYEAPEDKPRERARSGFGSLTASGGVYDGGRTSQEARDIALGRKKNYAMVSPTTFSANPNYQNLKSGGLTGVLRLAGGSEDSGAFGDEGNYDFGSQGPSGSGPGGSYDGSGGSDGGASLDGMTDISNTADLGPNWNDGGASLDGTGNFSQQYGSGPGNVGDTMGGRGTSNDVYSISRAANGLASLNVPAMNNPQALESDPDNPGTISSGPSEYAPGFWGHVGDFIGSATYDLRNNPIATALNVGLAIANPVVGAINTVSGLAGKGTVGGMATNAFGPQAQADRAAAATNKAEWAAHNAEQQQQAPNQLSIGPQQQQDWGSSEVAQTPYAAPPQQVAQAPQTQQPLRYTGGQTIYSPNAPQALSTALGQTPNQRQTQPLQYTQGTAGASSGGLVSLATGGQILAPQGMAGGGMFSSEQAKQLMAQFAKEQEGSGGGRKDPSGKDKSWEFINGADNTIKGLSSFALGGKLGKADSKFFEGQVEGQGDGMSDEVPFDIEDADPDKALLSKDEYVLPADVVSMIGNGSSNAGASEIDRFVKHIRMQAHGTKKQQKQLNGSKGLASLG